MTVFPLLSYKALKPGDLYYAKLDSAHESSLTTICEVKETGFLSKGSDGKTYDCWVEGEKALRHLIIHRITQDGELEILAGEESYLKLTGRTPPRSSFKS